MEPRPAWATPVRMIFLIVAVLCFLLAFFGVTFGHGGPLPIGLAFFAGAFLF